MIENRIIKKREECFLRSLTLSKNTFKLYKTALNSSFLKSFLSEEYGYHSVFEIEDIKELWRIYTVLNLHPKNVSNHRSYSAVLMKYIKYLNGGEKYGRRIDYGIKKTKST